jgi:hypothetical protein
MSDQNHIQVAVEANDELTVKVVEVDDTLVATVSSGDTLTAKSESVYAVINRGIGYVWAGVYNIIKDVMFYRYRKTKGGNTRVTKSGAKRITSRELQ